MSVASRLISGSAASWAQIAVTMVAQVALVPIYLNHWSVRTYGIWLAIQAIVNVLSMVDLGHQTFLGYEFLRFGKEKRNVLGKYLTSGMGIGLLISLAQVLLIFVLLFSGGLPFFLGESGMKEDTEMLFDAGLVLIMQAITWMIVVSISGLLTRAVMPFGYFPRVAWWGFLYAIINTVSPLVAVVLGGDLLITGIVASSAYTVLSIPLYLDLLRILRKEKVPIGKPSWKLGYKNFIQSLALSGKSLFENFRQQGTRLVLAPLSGAVGLAAFATMRTGANVALQGLNTITNPLMPDLIRFLHQRDQMRSEAAFGTIWIVVIALLSPGVVILQAFVEPLFLLWTRGKIPFDPTLFSILSLSVLVYAVIQPAIAVVIGNNMLKVQLALSFIAAVVVIGGISFMVPTIGIVGAGIALLISELCVSIGYLVVARKWMANNALLWPAKAFQIAVAAVCLAAIGMGSLIFFPEYKWLILIVAMLLFLSNLWRYWMILPAIATDRARELLRTIPGIKLYKLIKNLR